VGKRGPLPTPTPLHLLRGNPSKLKLPRNERATCAGHVDPPEYLTEDARKLWERLAPELHTSGLLGPRYLAAFEILIASVIQWRRAHDVLMVTGPLVRGRHDDMVSSPAAREFARFAVLVRAYAAEFGLTPAAVSNIARTEQRGVIDADDPERYLT
jgi:P27 family predicted phage terminase small subunit